MAPTEQDSITAALLGFKALAESYLLPSLPGPLRQIVQAGLNTTTSVTPYLVSVYSNFASIATNTLSKSSSSAPEITTLITTLVLIVSTYLSFKILNYIRRTLVSWVMFGIKAVVLLVLVQAAWYINAYGWDKFVADVSWWSGVVWGLFEEAVDGNAGGRVPRGMRSRADAKARNRGYAYGGREQVPVGTGRRRW